MLVYKILKSAWKDVSQMQKNSLSDIFFHINSVI